MAGSHGPLQFHFGDDAPGVHCHSLTSGLVCQVVTWRHFGPVAHVRLTYNSDTWEHTMDVMISYTGVTEFLLLGFSEDPRRQNLIGFLFLVAYLAALLVNGLIIIVITSDPRLHTPVYFFLKNLSLIDLCYIYVTVPKVFLNSLMNRNTISFLGCVSQVVFFAGFGATELLILTVMSYDRNVAICHPLHCEIIMSKGACGHMVVASYVSALVYGAMHASVTFSTNFNSNKIHHFFCDIPQIMVISDPKMNIDEASVSLIVVIMTIICFTSISYSYVNIFSAVLNISSKEERSQTLSTCIPHLVVVALFTFTGALAYLKPPSSSQTILDLLLSVSYTVFPPIMNPIKYSLRNKDMKAALE
ncbi:putative olfactory receptor 14L1 [Manis pentadactyla]|uniref:putative olfactory receptor 14L1 n=1 Tax=Manis pentadactyla TaxID=143292 RepID=UPI00255C462E|nr:putative olfactory receptor 14L1 [Manis pentadactyla]